MSLNVKIGSWSVTEEEAKQMVAIIEAGYPNMPKVLAESMSSFLQTVTLSNSGGAMVAQVEGEVIAASVPTRGSSPERPRLMFAVAPRFQRQGVGSRLFDCALENLKKNPKFTEMECHSLDSLPEGQTFLEKRGFREVDYRVFSEREVHTPFPESFLLSLQRRDMTPFRWATGKEYREECSTWEERWWRFIVETMQDIPSNLERTPLTFEEWKNRFHKSKYPMENIILALVGEDMAGMVMLGPVNNKKSNIDFTAVARAYRRRGLSLVLKVKAFELAKELGADIVTTQNHSNNPMLQANLRLGFAQVDCLREFVLSLL